MTKINLKINPQCNCWCKYQVGQLLEEEVVKLFSGNSTAVLQLPCCLSNQEEISDFFLKPLIQVAALPIIFRKACTPPTSNDLGCQCCRSAWERPESTEAPSWTMALAASSSVPSAAAGWAAAPEKYSSRWNSNTDWLFTHDGCT